jgi:CheY-like chemotaxis protein
VEVNGTETILLVEDQDEVRAIAQLTLTRHGYVVVSAANGEEALRVLKGHARRIDLLLTDVIMPGQSGRELVERVRELRADIRVLYTSGYTDDAIVRRGALEPGAAFLQKPFTPDVLLRKVREVLDSPGA